MSSSNELPEDPILAGKDWIINLVGREDVLQAEGMTRGIYDEDFIPAPPSSILPPQAAYPQANLTPRPEPVPEPTDEVTFWPASRRERVAEDIRKHPFRNVVEISGVVAVLAAVAGFGLGYTKGSEQAAPRVNPATVSAVNPVDVLLTHPSLMEGFVCPAQLDAEASLIAGANPKRAQFYHEAANLMVSELDPTKLKHECPDNASVAVPFNSPTSINVATNLGSMTVRLIDVLPDLQP